MRIPIFVGLLACALWALAVNPAGWRPGPQMTDVENGAVWHNPLTQYLQQVLVHEPLPGDQPGRYRVSMTVRTETNGYAPLVLAAWEGTNSTLSLARTPIGVAESTTPTQWHAVSLTFDVKTGVPVTVGVLFTAGKGAPCGWLEIRKDSVKLERIDVPLAIAWTRVVKIRYTHRERGSLDAYLTNTTDVPRRAVVRPAITDDAGETTTGAPQRVSVPAHATVRVAVPFAMPKRDGGFEATLTLLNGETVLDARSADAFCVSDTPFLFANNTYGGYFNYIGPGAHGMGLKGMQEKVLDSWDAYAKQAADAVESLRRSYGTAHEFFAWAREDALYLAETSDAPYLAGQCSWPESRKQFVYINGLMRAQGIAPYAYVNSVSFGWPAFPCLQQRPEWFQPHALIYNTRALEAYQRGEEVTGEYAVAVPTYNVPSPADGKTFLDHHIEQLVAAAKDAGWEVYRYDAGPLPRQYMPRTVDTLRRLRPSVYVGTNMAGVYTDDPETVANRAAYCLKGSMMMDEPIGFAWLNASNPNRKWVDWMNTVRTSSHLVRATGGHFAFINLYGNWYANSLGFACGGHPYHPCCQCPYGDTGRFMVRYGYYFYDLRTQRMVAPESCVAVESRQPVWWKLLVSERKLDARHRQVIVPLFNPPTGAEVVDTTIPAQVAGATLTFTPATGETVHAWLLTAEPTARREPLPVTREADGRCTVAVPAFWAWTNIVFDCHR